MRWLSLCMPLLAVACRPADQGSRTLAEFSAPCLGGDSWSKSVCGPFSPELRKKCHELDGGSRCDGERWSRTLYSMVVNELPAEIRSRNCLASGTDGSIHQCGPFTLSQVETCIRFKGGAPCVGTRWNKEFYTRVAEAARTSEAAGSEYAAVLEGGGGRPFMKLTRSGEKNAAGLEVLTLSLLSSTGTALSSVRAVSGVRNYEGLPRQNFRVARESVSGSKEPLPEAVWLVHYPNEGQNGVYWAGGVGNLDASHGPALGPVWIPLRTRNDYPTERDAIGIHLDADQPEGVGTAGCVGVATRAEIREVTRWFGKGETAPRTLIVDWGLGTVKGGVGLSLASLFSAEDWGLLPEKRLSLEEQIRAVEAEESMLQK